MRRSAASWFAPLAVAVIVLGILVVVGVAATRDGGPEPTSADPTPAESSTTSSAGTPSESATSSTVPSVDITKPAKDAAKDGFPALVPSEVPPGWVATDASYSPDTGNGPVWQVTFQLPDGGQVVLTQSELALPKAVGRFLGRDAERNGRVDLRRFGTGYWFAYAAGDGAGIAKQLPSTSAVIAAPTTDDAVTLAKQLLTFEDYDSPEAG